MLKGDRNRFLPAWVPASFSYRRMAKVLRAVVVVSMLSLPYESGLLRYLQPRDVALGVKPLEDFQTTSLIFFAAVFLLGIGRLDLERRRLVPASFDFGVNEGQKYGMIVAGN